jgi:outer membrane protein OmpA-like peptidoglycan-associated protein
MAESVAERAPERRPEDPFDELRSLLVGPEQRELLELHSHLHDSSVQTQAVASVLPDAFALKVHDPKLSGLVAPMVEEAITASVKRNPQPLADALFPVIGPAIRKAIQHALAAMMESFNRSVEHSLSWRALRWRWMAWRTGKPFAEIVLLNTIEYRVEQIFLIHADSGLLLQHVALDRSASDDADQISAMLTAIRDFARDSFKVGGGETLEALHIGDLDVFVEQGPFAALAAVVRGTAPQSLRVMFQDALESIHRQFGPQMQTFRGDASSVAAARPLLADCLVSQARQRQPRAIFRPVVVVALIVAMAVAAWAVFRWRDTARWNAYLDRLNAEPGIAVLSSGRRAGRFFVVGLRDPLARDPSAITADLDLPAKTIESRWEPYQALLPAFVVARATDLLHPPEGITLTFQDGTLTATGAAPEQWISESERIAAALAGVRQFRHAGPEPAALLRQRLEALSVHFLRGQSRIGSDQQPALSEIAAALGQLNATLAVRNRRATIELQGFTDADGPDALNASLSQARANAVLAAIDTRPLTMLDFVARGTRAPAPGREQDEAAKGRDRRVSLRVSLSDSAGSSRR